MNLSKLINLWFSDKFGGNRSFFNCYLAAPLPTLGHCRGGNLINLDVNHCVLFLIWPKGHQKPRNEVGSQRPSERLMRLQPGSFWFLLTQYWETTLENIEINRIIGTKWVNNVFSCYIPHPRQASAYLHQALYR